IAALTIRLRDGSIACARLVLFGASFLVSRRSVYDDAHGYELEGVTLTLIGAFVYEDGAPALHVSRAEMQAVQNNVAVASFADFIRVEGVTVRMRRRAFAEVAGAGNRAGACLGERARDLPFESFAFGFDDRFA